MEYCCAASPEVPGAAVGLRDRNAYLMDSFLLGAIPTGTAFMEGGMAAPVPVLFLLARHVRVSCAQWTGH